MRGPSTPPSNRANRRNGNVAAARAVLIGTNDFLNDHPANMELFRRYVQSRDDSDRLREAFSVPLLEETAGKLFVEKRQPQTRIQKLAVGAMNMQTKRRISKDMKEASKNPAKANHKAAAEMVKHLPKAAMLRQNQTLMVALARHLESREGQDLADVVGHLFDELLEQYQDLQEERELIALGKIALAHQSLLAQTIAGQELADVSNELDLTAREAEFANTNDFMIEEPRAQRTGPPELVIVGNAERKLDVVENRPELQIVRDEPKITEPEPRKQEVAAKVAETASEPDRTDGWIVDGEVVIPNASRQLSREPVEQGRRSRRAERTIAARDQARLEREAAEHGPDRPQRPAGEQRRGRMRSITRDTARDDLGLGRSIGKG